jgi:hypothetical protein
MLNLDLLESLSNYYIEFGIFTSEGMQTVNIPVSSEDTDTIMQMKIGDIMYFTEYGTLSLPGTFVLEKSLYQINYLLNESLSDLVDRILEEKIQNESEIDSYFQELCLKIQTLVQNYIRSIIQNNNKLDNLLNVDNTDNKYIYDLDKLSDYIKCKYFKK